MSRDDIFNPKTDIGDGSLAGRYSQSWVEESFGYDEPEKHHGALQPETRGFLGSSVDVKKIKILACLAIIGLVIIFGRVFYLQVIKGDYYRSLAEHNRIRLTPIPAERGLIFDREGIPMVTNVPSFSLAIVPQDFPQDKIERQRVISQVAYLSGVPETDIEERVKKYRAYSYESLTLKENMDYESALKLYIQNADLPGILIEKASQRLYRPAETKKYGELLSLSPVLGYLGKINEKELTELKPAGYLLSDYIGKEGLEKTYESTLRGKFGQRKIEIDALGREQNILAEEPPEPGKNITLSIDLEAQAVLEKAMSRVLRNTNGPRRGAAIAMDPRNGEILAIVNWPTFDNNDFVAGLSVKKYSQYSENPDQPLFNRAIAGLYPSGSIIKPALAAAALQEGIITRWTTINSVGGLQVDKWFFKDWQAGGHGQTDVVKAIAWSVNTFFYYIGGGYKTFNGLGVSKIAEYLHRFGIARETGVDLPGESTGLLPTREWKGEIKKESWYIGDTYNLSIGQGDLLVTPLQAAVWTAAVANGGQVLKPHLVHSITDPVSKTTTQPEIETVDKNFISAANLEIVRQGMRACVTIGSCQGLAGLSFAAAGKTGTAQWSEKKANHAWFTSFAPVQKPQIVVTVLVEEGGEGGSIALPVAREFLSWWGTKYLR